MLSKEDNELLTRVGPGTPMGNAFRRYWVLAGISREVPEPDSPPVRVKLLGEDLVMFRDTNGKVGLLAEKCSHRRASLFYGRNEECGLRCIYHGWKYDVEGHILDTPAEPAESMIKHHVQHTAYPCIEVNGMIMTYMGPKEKQPLLPDFEWFTLPEGHVRVGDKYWNENNWLQGVEGDCDSSHFDYLHRVANRINVVEGGIDLKPGFGEHLDWKLEEGPWWIKVAAIRRPAETADKYDYVRVNAFALPCMGLPPTGPVSNGITDGFQVVFQTPADDTHTWRVDVNTRRSQPFGENQWRPGGGEPTFPGLEGLKAVGPDWRKTANKDNDYLIDREVQKTKVFSGIPFGAHTQDAAVTESMGPISDRENEHLGACDTEPIAMRRMLLQVVRDVAAGKDPPGIAFTSEDNAQFRDFFVTHATLPKGTAWNDRATVAAKIIQPSPYSY